MVYTSKEEVKRMNKKELGALIIDGTDDFYRVAKSILKEEADCQDAVQEAVSKAFAKIDTLREKKYAKTWFIVLFVIPALVCHVWCDGSCADFGWD